MSDYKELVRRLQMHPPQETPFVCADAIRAIEKLSAEVEQTKAHFGRLASTCMETLNELPRLVDTTALPARAAAVVARMRALEAEVERLKQELAEAREKAKALDELEAWMSADQCNYVPDIRSNAQGFSVRLSGCYGSEDHHGEAWFALAPTLAAAIRASLEKARGA